MADLSGVSVEDLQALKAGDLSKVSMEGLHALRALQHVSAAEQVAADPVTKGAEAVAHASPEALIAGSAPGRFLLQPARGLLELGGHLGLPGGESADALKKLIDEGRTAYENKGMDIAGIAGQVVSPAVLKAAKIIPALGMAGKMAGSALTGATAGATTPTEGGPDFWKEKVYQTGTGGIVGGALPPAGALVKGVLGSAYKAIEPIMPAIPSIGFEGGPMAIWNRFKDTMAGPAKTQISDALMKARELVPGSAPTVGEAVAALPGASPIAALQQKIAATRVASPGFIQRGQDQEAARAAALGTVADTPEELALRESMRSRDAKIDYERAFSFRSRLLNMLPNDPTLRSLLEDPYIKKTLPDALDLMTSKGVAGQDRLTQFLHYIKVGLDKQLSRTGDTALASTEKEAVAGVKTRLLALVDEKNPSYAVARENFIAASKPIDQMRLGQGLQDKLAAPLGTQERAASFASAVKNPESLIRSEVGGPARGLEDILTPDQLRAVQSVGSDLGRKAQFERLARGTRLTETPGEVTSPIPNLWSRPASMTNYVAKKVFGHDLQNRVNAIAGPELLDPKAFAASLMDKPLSQRKAIVDALMQQLAPAVPGLPSAAIAQHY